MTNPESFRVQFVPWNVAMAARGIGDPVTALIGGGVGAVGSVIGGLIGSHAANSAAKIQAANAARVAQDARDAASRGQGLVDNATGNAVNTVNTGVENANRTLADYQASQQAKYQPYIDLGTQGARQLQQATGEGGDLTKQFSFNPQDVTNSPEYQFDVQQGTQAVLRNQAATGALGSGGAAKSLASYIQGLGTTAYQQAYGNALNTFQTNRNNTVQNLQSLLQGGMYGTSGFNQASQNAGNQIAGNTLTGAQYGANIPLQSAQYNSNLGLQAAQIAGNALTNGANASAAGTIGSSNAWERALGGVTSAATNGAQLYSLTNALNNGMYSGAGGYGSGPQSYGASPYGSSGSTGFNYSAYNPGGQGTVGQTYPLNQSAYGTDVTNQHR